MHSYLSGSAATNGDKAAKVKGECGSTLHAKLCYFVSLCWTRIVENWSCQITLLESPYVHWPHVSLSPTQVTHLSLAITKHERVISRARKHHCQRRGAWIASYWELLISMCRLQSICWTHPHPQQPSNWASFVGAFSELVPHACASVQACSIVPKGTNCVCVVVWGRFSNR